MKLSPYNQRCCGGARGEFPLDMLRYDCCYPVTSVEHMDNDARGQRQVKLRHIGDHRMWSSTYPRWASFGRHVFEVDGETLMRRGMAGG